MKIDSICGGCKARIILEDKSNLSIAVEFNKWLKVHERCLGIGEKRRSAIVSTPYHEPCNDPD